MRPFLPNVGTGYNATQGRSLSKAQLGGGMALRQQFSTTIYSWDGSLSAEVSFLPRTDMAIPDSNDEQYFRFVIEALGPEVFTPLRTQSLERGLAIFLMVASEGNLDIVRKMWNQVAPILFDDSELPEPNRLDISDEYLDFAKELLSSSRVPIEESPLTAASLGELFSKAAKASPTTLGAMVGWMIAGNTPWLLLWVPTGIILIRSAVGIGKGLEEGCYARVKKLFTPPRKTRTND